MKNMSEKWLKILQKHGQQAVFFVLLGMLLGIFLGSFFSPHIVKTVIFTLILLSFAFLAVFYANTRKYTPFLFIFIAAVFIGYIQIRESLSLVGTENFLEQEVQGEGNIISFPKKTERGQYFSVKFTNCKTPSEEGDICPKEMQKTLVFTGNFDDFYDGEYISVSCILEKPENKSPDFDWVKFLAKDSIYYQCYNAEIQKLDTKNTRSLLGKFRKTLEENISKHIPEPQSGLASGLLFGGSDRLSESIQEDFSKTSMTHIVAVSGYNISLISIYVLIVALAFGLWRRQAFVITLISILFFVALIGFPPSGVRAGIMGGILLFAMRLGKANHAVFALLFALVLMLFLHPMFLRWDIGFQLSFLATLGILLLLPLWQEKIEHKNTPTKIFLEVLLTTIAVQIFVLPIIFFHFGSFSLLSILANILVLPAIPFAMLFSLIVAVFGFLPDIFVFPFSFIANGILFYEIAVIQFLADFTFATITWEDFPRTLFILWYTILIAFLSFFSAKKRFDFRKKYCKKYEK